MSACGAAESRFAPTSYWPRDLDCESSAAMFVRFPDWRALELALTLGAIPAEESNRPVRAFVRPDHNDGIVIELTAASPELLRGLTLCGAALLADEARSPAEVREQASIDAPNWYALLPLQTIHHSPIAPQNKASEAHAASPVGWLLVIETRELFLDVVSELLRLGADEPAYAIVPASDSGDAQYWIRVRELPAYTRLRVELADEPKSLIRAYTQRRPGLWVECEFTHPLERGLVPPRDRWWLLASPRRWTEWGAPEFEPISTALEIAPLTAAPLLKPRVRTRLPVTLRLVPTPMLATPSLWVLDQSAIANWEEWLRSVGEADLNCFRFAVATSQFEQRLVLWWSEAKRSPKLTTLPSGAAGYAALPAVSDIYVPVGWRLDPPLAPSRWSQLLRRRAQTVVWLEPYEGDRFRPFELETSAFHPLTEWVEYVLDQAGEVLDGWVRSTRFEFGPQTGWSPWAISPGETSIAQVPASSGAWQNTNRESLPDRSPVAPRGVTSSKSIVEPAGPDEQTLTSIEILEDSLRDAPDSAVSIWRKLAAEYESAGRWVDAAEAWSRVVFERVDVSAADFAAWDRVVDRQLFVEDLTLASMDGPAMSEIPLARWVPRVVRWGLFAGAGAADTDRPTFETLAALRQESAQRMTELSPRVVWLLALSFGRLSGGDSLLLAEVREHLIDRTVREAVPSPAGSRSIPSGLCARDPLSPEQLAEGRERGQQVQQLLAEMNAQCGSGSVGGGTRAYVALTAAFVCARWGQTEQCDELRAQARRHLAQTPAGVSSWLLAAYEERIVAAQSPSGIGRPWPAERLAELAALTPVERFAVDEWRGESRLLEPVQRITAARRWLSAVESRSADVTRAVSRRNSVTAIEQAPSLDGVSAHEVLARWLRESGGPSGQVEGTLSEWSSLLRVAMHFHIADVVTVGTRLLTDWLQRGDDVMSDAGHRLLEWSELFELWPELARFGVEPDWSIWEHRFDRELALIQSIWAQSTGMELLSTLHCAWFRVATGDREGAVELFAKAQEQLGPTLASVGAITVNPAQRRELVRQYVRVSALLDSDAHFSRLLGLVPIVATFTETYVIDRFFSLNVLAGWEAMLLSLLPADHLPRPAGSSWAQADREQFLNRLHRDLQQEEDLLN